MFDLGGWELSSKVRRKSMFLKASFEPEVSSEDFDGLVELVSSFWRLVRLMYEEFPIETTSVKLSSGPVLSDTKPP